MPETFGMPSPLDKLLADFLRQRRGEQTFAEFARKLGLASATLYRLERGEQSITLGRLHQIMARLNCGLADVFPTDAQWKRYRGR